MRRTEPYLSTYLHSKGIRLGLPIGGTFELTARCNFNCPMCYVHLSKEDVEAQGKELTAAQWISIAKEAKEQGMVFALLTGGEPFVREDFFEIYDAMKSMGIMVSINSNGSMLKGEVLRKLIENPPFRINVSLYGGCKETYETMCGQDAFDLVLENIHALKDAGIDVRINLSITPYNHQDMEKIYGISKALNVHVKASSYMYPPIRVNGEKYGQGDRLSSLDAARCLTRWQCIRYTEEEFEAYAKSLKDMIPTEEPECPADLDEKVSCRAGRSSFWITWDGKMLPCGMLPRPIAYPFKSGFLNAWETIKKETQAIRLPSQCAACPKRKICPVCAAVCITETGHFDAVPHYVCEQMDGLIQETWRVYQERNACHADKETVN